MASWEIIESIEGLEGLNGLDVGSPHYLEYFKRIQDIKNANEKKNRRGTNNLEKQEADLLIKEAIVSLGIIGIKLDVLITFNPSPMPPLYLEMKYADEHGFKIEICEDGYYRWFKPIFQ
jgi:hypothetical protein